MTIAYAGKAVRWVLASTLAGSALCVVLSPASSRADFFDELFGLDNAPAIPRHFWSAGRSERSGRIRSRFSYLPERHASRQRKARFLPLRHEIESRADGAGRDYVAGSRPVRPLFCARPSAVRNMPVFTQLLNDGTLRPGDIVATAGGVRVFHGGGACPHKPRDFIPLAGADLSRGQRRMLAGLDVTTSVPTHVGRR